MVGATGIEPV